MSLVTWIRCSECGNSYRKGAECPKCANAVRNNLGQVLDMSAVPTDETQRREWAREFFKRLGEYNQAAQAYRKYERFVRGFGGDARGNLSIQLWDDTRITL